MRIAILTLPLHTNYGGILQAYALQTVLERMGHDVHVLSPPPYIAHDLWVMPVVYAKRLVEKFIFRRDISILYDGYNRPRQFTDKFIKRHINSYYVTDWEKLNGVFDAYVVGSDQIWRPKYESEFCDISNAFLNFAEKWSVKRIAYAVSFGTSEWEFSKEQERLCRELVLRFIAVSVREKTGVNLCNEHLGISPVHVLDPTMLLSKSDYNTLISGIRDTNEGCGKLMCYILDSSSYTADIVKRYEESLGLELVYANSLVEKIDADPSKRIQPPVETWLSLFRDANFVVTDSFHACVFSILYKKSFVVLTNDSRGNARIESLLSMFGLEDRIVHSIEDPIISSPIDFTHVDEVLKQQQENSYNFLREAISL